MYSINNRVRAPEQHSNKHSTRRRNMQTFLYLLTSLATLAVHAFAACAVTLPQFELLFTGPLVIGNTDIVNGSYGSRLNVALLTGNLSDSSGKLAAKLVSGTNVENGIVAADGIYFPNGRLTYQWEVDGTFAFIEARGVGEVFVAHMDYMHLETDSETWSFLNSRFLFANVTWDSPTSNTPTVSVFGLV
ncbi:hypothetical protein CERSUDRAFT_117132 [Gelatoporia subvermispora B]|uniref:Uncharacterized protein n=1 Tax=Ceriporiopsis subvermispora (strain B) TaxID=914234 RepID=M2R771_CERS8|nr:hypothetical protein CERSUDRAFT_117132 [Gelatoporia subvermispora B]